MKTLLAILTVFTVSNFVCAQEFPSPTNFDMTYCYLWPNSCGPEYGPTDTINYYSFDAPDLTDTESELVGYNLYLDGNFIVSFTTTTYEAKTSGAGDYYVTATYVNPSGESEPSNVVTGMGQAISTADFTKTNNILLYPNPLGVNQEITINSEYDIVNVSAYNILGNIIFDSPNAQTKFTATAKGIYFLKIKTENGILVKKIIVQ